MCSPYPSVSSLVHQSARRTQRPFVAVTYVASLFLAALNLSGDMFAWPMSWYSTCRKLRWAGFSGFFITYAV